jgi:hypothetical protein
VLTRCGLLRHFLKIVLDQARALIDEVYDSRQLDTVGESKKNAVPPLLGEEMI